MADWPQDLRFAVRTHGRHPGVAALAVAALALGIAAAANIALTHDHGFRQV